MDHESFNSIYELEAVDVPLFGDFDCSNGALAASGTMTRRIYTGDSLPRQALRIAKLGARRNEADGLHHVAASYIR